MHPQATSARQNSTLPKYRADDDDSADAGAATWEESDSSHARNRV